MGRRLTQRFRLSSARELSIIIILVLVVVLSWSFMTSKQTKRNILTVEKKRLLLLIGPSQSRTAFNWLNFWDSDSLRLWKRHVWKRSLGSSAWTIGYGLTSWPQQMGPSLVIFKLDSTPKWQNLGQTDFQQWEFQARLNACMKRTNYLELLIGQIYFKHGSPN